MKRILLTVVLLSSVVAPARADHDLAGLYIALLVVPPTIAVGGLVTSIGNFVVAGGGARPHLAWTVTGYGFGALNLASGTFLAVASGDSLVSALGGVQIAIGLVGMLSATIGLNQPDARITLHPLVAPDAEGGLVVGVGADLTRLF